jgi:hypothetical protein
MLARLAARQHGLVTRAQLLALGLGAGAIQHRLDTARLHRIHIGVYALAYHSPSPQTRLMAAVLACGPSAVLSHRSAAQLWGIGPVWRGEVEVTVAGNRSRRGVHVHRRSTIADHATNWQGIPVTTVPQTLIDLGTVLDAQRLSRAVNDACVKRLIDPKELTVLLAGCTGTGASRVRRTLGQNAPTRSVLEDRFLAFVDKHALPRPEVNQRIAGHEVDAVWRAQRLIVELDGRAFHDGPAAFERDRERDAHLMAAGYRVLRITWRRLSDRGEREARRLRGLLETAPGGPVV